MNRTAFSLPDKSEYRTRGGLAVTRVVEQFTGGASRLDDLIDLLDRRRGVVLSSGTTVPGRYESFDLGFADPPLALETSGANFSLSALNPRGEVLIAFLGDALREPCVVISEKSPRRLAGHIIRGAAPVEEDQRTRRASVMSLVRDLVAAFSANDDPLLGLFGAFAYDLVFQIEDLVQKRARENDQRDIVLYVPDRLLAYDRATGRGVVLNYDFAWNGKSTSGLPRDTAESVYSEDAAAGFCRPRAWRIPGHGGDGARRVCARRSVRGGAGAALRRALRTHAGGSVPATVPDQSVALWRDDNLGDGEFLVSASPEMFVRSDGRRVETCPISGTIARGSDAIRKASSELPRSTACSPTTEVPNCRQSSRSPDPNPAYPRPSNAIVPTSVCSFSSGSSAAICVKTYAYFRAFKPQKRVSKPANRRAHPLTSPPPEGGPPR